jgi:predicted NBD/HSP70 family sugar kinase
MLSEATGFRVDAANDASVGAIAESTFGAGSGVSDMIYLNGGASGIGGGIISGGLLQEGASGFAGELGHTLVNSDGVPCHCGSTGCLETEARRAELLDALGLGPQESERLEDVLLAHYVPGRIPDAKVARVVDRQVQFLGIGLAGAANLVNPSLIVLGGFLGSLYRAAPEALEDAVRAAAMSGLRDSVTLAAAALGSSILMIGAAELVFARLLADPTGPQ